MYVLGRKKRYFFVCSMSTLDKRARMCVKGEQSCCCLWERNRKVGVVFFLTILFVYKKTKTFFGFLLQKPSAAGGYHRVVFFGYTSGRQTDASRYAGPAERQRRNRSSRMWSFERENGGGNITRMEHTGHSKMHLAVLLHRR